MQIENLVTHRVWYFNCKAGHFKLLEDEAKNRWLFKCDHKIMGFRPMMNAEGLEIINQ